MILSTPSRNLSNHPRNQEQTNLTTPTFFHSRAGLRALLTLTLERGAKDNVTILLAATA